MKEENGIIDCFLALPLPQWFVWFGFFSLGGLWAAAAANAPQRERPAKTQTKPLPINLSFK